MEYNVRKKTTQRAVLPNIVLEEEHPIQAWFNLVKNDDFRNDFFQLFNRFQLFSSENCFLKVARQNQNRSKKTILKESVDDMVSAILLGLIWSSRF
jgi:hypothetical protein